MTKPKITLRGLATANPPWYVTQAEAYQHYTRLFPMTPAEQELYRRLLLEGPVRGRHVGMDAPEDALEADPDRLVQRYLKFGRSIGADAVRGALAQAGLAPSDIGGLVVNSCTGYLCPGLTSYIAEDVGLPHNLAICDLMGMGCGAALPNLEMATGMLLRNPEKPVLSVAVEICTATLFMGDDPGLVVSNSIFGDGAAAAVLAVGPAGRGPQRRMRFLDFQSGLFPEYREHLHYRTENHRLRNVLGPRVPVIGAQTVQRVAERLLARQGLTTADIRHWIVHPGGTLVLERVARRFHLAPNALRQSYAVFHHYGNMSSPSVLFVLKRVLEEDRPKPGEKGLMLAFGAGFSAFAALVEF